jgi:hypothetical protein
MNLRNFGWDVTAKESMSFQGVDVVAFKYPNRVALLESKHAKNLGQADLDKAKGEISGEQLRKMRDSCAR